MTWHHPHAVTRRAVAGRTLIFGLFGFLLLAFFRLQVVSSSTYRLRSEENRHRPVPLAAPRGLILDRHGVVLAENVPGYTIAMLASTEDSLRAALHNIADLAEIDSTRMTEILKRFRRARHEPALVRRDASFELVSALEETRVTLPGLVIQSEPKRSYPFGAVVAHAIGYIGEITEAELMSGRFEDARPGTLIGRDGLERQYDRVLRGQDGVRFIEVDAFGRTVREPETSILQPNQGDTLRTTLDIELQTYIAETFPEGDRGAVMAMDPRNGDVLALYSAPSFDNNAFVGVLDQETWNTLSGSEDQPLFNRAVEGGYPPASLWKLAVAASALQRGIVTFDQTMDTPCRGGLLFGNRYFRCWEEKGHGDLNLRQAIQYSCDTYFYQLGLKLSLDHLLHDAVAMGFLDPSGIDLPDERRPIFPPSKEYYDERYGERGWTRAVTLNLAIGQGENTQSLSNMVRFYAMLANENGEAPPPRLVQGPVLPKRSLGLREDQLEELRETLVTVVRGGTAAASQIANLNIAGKTGTAQNSHGPPHGWFIAFAPAADPEIVVGAIVEFAEHGSDVAPLVTRTIARHLLGPDAAAVRQGRSSMLVLPSDSAPVPEVFPPDTSQTRQTLRRERDRGGAGTR